MRHISTRQAPLAIALGTGLLAAAVAAVTAAKLTRRGRAPDDAPGRAARRGFGRYAVTGRSVTIAKPRQELFRYWRDFSNLASFMENLIAVERLDERAAIGSGSDARADDKRAQSPVYLWTIRAPGGTQVELRTCVVREVENELIAWRSVEGSEIDTEGRVTFEDAPGDRGTRVGLIVAYRPPGGAAGRAFAKLLSREPSVQARHDLKRFKMLMETGEIATSARQRDATRASKMEKD